jgi:hypothetical protein
MVFVESMGDTFEDNPQLDEWRKELLDLIESCDHMDAMLLTKRPQNIRNMVPPHWLENWPRHVMVGTTVEDQRACARIDDILKVDAFRFLSVEPLVEQVDLSCWLERRNPDGTPMIGFVIVGGESGNDSSVIAPMHSDWVRKILDDCIKNGVLFHFKQHGGWVHESQLSYLDISPLKAKRCKTYDWKDGTKSFWVDTGERGEIFDGAWYQFTPNARRVNRLIGGCRPVPGQHALAPLPIEPATATELDTIAPAHSVIHQDETADEARVVTVAAVAPTAEVPRPDLERKSMVDGLPPMTLIRTAEGEIFAQFSIGHRHETVALDSREFRDHVQLSLMQHDGSLPSDAKVRSIIATTRATARQVPNVGQVFSRIAPHDGGIVIDLGTTDGRVVQVTPDGWEVLTDSPVLFRRGAGLAALPLPVTGGGMDDLQALLPLDARGYAIALGFILASFRPQGPYPVLSVAGPAGAGKSTLTDVIKALTDPSSATRRVMPENGVDLFRAAQGNHVLAYDNVSALSTKLSDALCKLSTGAGLAQARRGYGQEVVLHANCPVIINGIGDAITRGDLQQRVWRIDLPPYGAEGHRLNETVLRAAKVERGGRAFGLILDMLAAGLRNVDNVKLSGGTRMIDAARWVAACTKQIDWEPEFFMEYLAEIATDSAEDAIEGNSLLQGIVSLIEAQGTFEGTMTELLAAITAQNPHAGKLPPANKASAEMGRHVDALQRLGISYDRLPRTGNGRRIRLAKAAPAITETTVTTVTDTQADWLDWVAVAV